MNYQLLIVFLLTPVGSHLCSAGETNSRVHTDRYTLHATSPRVDQAAPMNAIINVSMGKDVLTVGDAIREILKGSGYRWQSTDGNDKLLDTLPLPSVVRELGPISLSDALETVAGEAWHLRNDHLNRIVWFDINTKHASAK